MWFKVALFVYHAVLVANTDALPKENGGTPLHRRHVVEDVGAPVLFPRQQTFRNETSPVETISTTSEGRTISFTTATTSDRSRETSVPRSSTPLLVATSTPISLQGPSRVSLSLSSTSVTLSWTSSYVSSRPALNVQVETISSARDQISSRAGSTIPFHSSSTATSDKGTSNTPSLVISDHEPSHTASVILGSDSALISQSTPTPSSRSMELSQTLSIQVTESRSRIKAQDSTTSSSSISSASTLSLTSQPTLTATASLAASDSHPSIPTPTPSVVSPALTPTNGSPNSASMSDSSSLFTSPARTDAENTIFSSASIFTSNGTPIPSQYTSVVIASSLQTMFIFTSTSIAQPLLPSSQFSETLVPNRISTSSTLSTVLSTTMSIAALPETSSGRIHSARETSLKSATSMTSSSSILDFTLPAESGSKASNISISTTRLLPESSPTVFPSSDTVTHNMDNQTTTRQVNAPATILTATISSAVPIPDVLSRSKNSFTILPRSTLVVSSTSSTSSQTPRQTSQATHARTNATAHPSSTRSRSAQSTSSFSNPNGTRIGEVDKTLVPFLPNSSMAATSLGTDISTSNGVTATRSFTSSEVTPSYSSTRLIVVGMETTNTLPSSATSTASRAAAASPTPTPLTTTQTAGVAIGSTAGVLLAVIAAIFLVRRYHAKHATRRSSDGSIYPKVAYIYDPTGKDNGRSSGGSSYTLISGGANRLPELSQTTSVHDRRPSNGFTSRYSDPGNPFRDPVYPHRRIEEPPREHYSREPNPFYAPVDTAGASAAAAAGVGGAGHHHPSTSKLASLQSPYHVTHPSPTLGPLLTNSNHYRHSRSLSRSSFHSYAHRRNSTMEYVPLSPYIQQSRDLESGRETTILDAQEEPFKYDILLPVNTPASSPDFITTRAPPPTPRTPVPITQQSGSFASPVSPIGSFSFQQSRDDPNANLTSSSSTTTTLGKLDRFSLGYDSTSGATYIRIASKNSTRQQSASNDSPVSPVSPVVPVHRGWDDIKRYSSGSGSSAPSSRVTPAPLSFTAAPPPRLQLAAPPAQKKKSLLQLRRKEPALAGRGHVVKPSLSSSLSSKPSLKYDKDLAFEAQRKSLLAKLNSMSGARAPGTVSPAPSASDSEYSHESGSKRWRRENHVAAAHTRSPSNNFF